MSVRAAVWGVLLVGIACGSNPGGSDGGSPGGGTASATGGGSNGGGTATGGGGGSSAGGGTTAGGGSASTGGGTSTGGGSATGGGTGSTGGWKPRRAAARRPEGGDAGYSPFVCDAGGSPFDVQQSFTDALGASVTVTVCGPRPGVHTVTLHPLTDGGSSLTNFAAGAL